MSVVFLINSEEHVRTGSQWCVIFAESIDAPIVPLVLGADQKVLEKHTEASLRRKFERQNQGETDALTVEPDVESVLACCRDVGCRLLVIMHSGDREDWQRELFESSTVRTVWLCPAADPPTDESHLIGGLSASAPATNRLSRQLMGMRADHWTIDNLPPSETDQDKRVELVRASFDCESHHPESLIFLHIESISKTDTMYSVGRKLLDHDFGTSVLLVREGQSMVTDVIDRFRRWTESITPPMNRSQRIKLQKDLEEGSKPNLEFLGLISASSMLAAFGLLQNSAAVIIGAMLIAPLMTPILGAGQAIAKGNKPLFRTASTAILMGFVGAFVSSALFGCLVMLVDKPDLSPSRATEIWARCNPSAIDFCVGLIGGMAAAYARTRSHLSSALAGAAIAAALVPPISTAGLQLVFGEWYPREEGRPILGPLVVVCINVLTIMIGSSFVLWLRGIRTRNREDRKDHWSARVTIFIVTATLLVLVAMYSG